MAFISIEVSSFVGSILAIIAGVLVLAFPTLLRYMIGLYLLLAGVLGLLTALWNNGTGIAGQSITLLQTGATVLNQYPTPELAPQQEVTLHPPATVIQLGGTALTVTATADAQDQVAELSETNNMFTLILR